MSDERKNAATEPKKSRASLIAKIIIGSAIGLFVFVIPLKFGGKRPTMFLSYLKNLIQGKTGDFLPWMVWVLTGIALFGAIVGTATKKKEHGKFFKSCFSVSPFNLCIRVLAFVIATMCIFNVGPEWLLSMDTGGLIIWDILPSLILFFLLGTILLPTLTEYGLMDLVGGVLKPIFRPLFRIPGATAPLAFSGLIGSGTVAIITTEAEYNKGRMTRREAVIISTSFCTIAYSAMMAYSTGISGLDDGLFGMAFAAIVVVVILGAALMSRIPPISKIPNTYHQDKADPYPETKGGMKAVVEGACAKAEHAPSPLKMLVNGSKSSFRLWMLVFPTIITLATIVLVLAMYTPVFNIIATPFVPMLEALGVPEAASVAPALFTGFGDLLLPFLAATSITSQFAKFILCVVGVTQLICMTESGLLLMKSNLQVKFWQLLCIFLEKTVIAFFVALIFGKIMGLA